MLRKILAALLLSTSCAFAQNAVLQSGPVTPGDPALWANDHVVAGASLRLQQLGLGLNPFKVTDGLSGGVCTDSAAQTGPYNEFCIGHDSSGNALLTIDSLGGLAAKGINVRLNGKTFALPLTGSAGNVGGPASSISGDLPTFADTTGKLLADSGITTSDPGVYHPGNISSLLQGGHRFGYLDRNVNYEADYFGFESTDCGTVPIRITVAGTPGTGGALVQFTLSDGSHLATVNYTTVNGDTTTTIATKLIAAFKANGTIGTIYAAACPDGKSGIGYIETAGSAANVVLFNQLSTFAQNGVGNIVTSVSQAGGSSLTLTAGWNIAIKSALANALEVAPVLVLDRNVTGRTPQIGDIIGQIIFVGKDTAGGDQQYGSLSTVIENPNSGTPIGAVALSSNTSSGGSFNVGQGWWSGGASTEFSGGRDAGLNTLNLGDIGYFGTIHGCYIGVNGANNNGVVSSQGANCGMLIASSGTGSVTISNSFATIGQFQAGTSVVDYPVFSSPVSGAVVLRTALGGTPLQLGGGLNDIWLGTNTTGLATNTVNGFPTFPTMPGVPSGTPAQATTGLSQCVIDVTDKKIECYMAGGWQHIDFVGGT